MIDSLYKTLIYDNRYKYILEGLKNTLIIALFAVLIGILLGLLVAFIKNRYKERNKGKLLNKLCDIYVTIIRGTPALLQLMILYYVIFKNVNNILLYIIYKMKYIIFMYKLVFIYFYCCIMMRNFSVEAFSYRYM